MNAPSPGRRDRKRQATTELLTRTAFQLFETHGFDIVTMEQIAIEADVAKGTLYNYFPSKEAVLAHYFHQSLANGWAEVRERLSAEPDTVARFHIFLDVAADWAQQHRAYLLHYLRHRFQESTATERQVARSGTAMVFGQLIRDAQQQGVVHGAHELEQLTTYLQFLYMGALLRWLSLPSGDLRAEFAAMLQLFLQGASSVPAVTTNKDLP